MNDNVLGQFVPFGAKILYFDFNLSYSKILVTEDLNVRQYFFL